jgi:hypothetical protein
MIKDYQNIISAACDRFNNSISQLDIISWLENFESHDWKKALIVLNSFEYYSTKDIIREFDFGLNCIIDDLKPNEKIFLIPIGKIGKSGMAMIYYLKKTPSFNNPNVSLLEYNDFSRLPENCKLVLVDDFSGTGGTIINYYDEIKSNLPQSHYPIALTIAFMEKAKAILKKKGIHILGNERIPAFSTRGSVFGYYPKMKAIRNFCFEYGDKLYPEVKYKKRETRQHPLGFSNSQSLIGFEHSIPNNTLSIIWADVKLKGTEKRWNPLFPRRGALISNRAKEFKQNQRYWASIIYKLGIKDDLFPVAEKYSKQTIQLLSIIYLKKKHKNVAYACQMLGINLKDYEIIIKEGQKKDLFDLDEELTEQAINIYDQIKKKVKFQKSNFINPELVIEEDMLYIPKSFRGNS